MHQYIPNTTDDQHKMLEELGVQNFEELLALIPEAVRFKGELPIEPGVSELEHKADVMAFSRSSASTASHISFLGAGSYDHYIPQIVDVLVSRSEFYTAYTPYQAEVSQGTLQAMFEYQSMICELTGMSVANASLYDGASALAEACLLAVRHTRRNRILIAETVNPVYREVAETYGQALDIQYETLPTRGRLTDLSNLAGMNLEDVAAVVVQSPNFFGMLEDINGVKTAIGSAGALFITVNNPMSLALIKSPGELGADIAVGEGQVLGAHQSYGGPYLGFMAVTEALTRKIPGRIVGETVDTSGRRAFVMVLRTREQDIRRERATSNICTNQGLVALTACIYMASLGKQGLRKVAELSTQKAHYLAGSIGKIPEFNVAVESPFFNEFIVECPVPATQVIQKAGEAGFLAGVAVEDYFPGHPNELLMAVTEKRTREQIDAFVKFLSTFA
ncbi:MAG: aminomethyl-transferring glycine dehydrogenase subunit GcvPA [Candidatus Marinimicrobia bacterium]|nr:aminomethyl-transferring glycine dehydrogenase subunit GcvPA [Candidatus Neomarinimicrobiota bacterium]MCF7840426.1 aminomethyl-transferring glycine dehydrogenase subunit GcvPA [Candidatus Neomarinimicrobiota bacterium]MCF7903371.1 aminomethyl-transferring glycine dehydrogenase subunit GcvPA [Candidatus Neomarinimicrobiota bacterium]